MKKSIVCLFFATAFLSAFNKDSNPGPGSPPSSIAPGSISGSVTPSGAAKNIIAFYTQGSSVDSIAPDSSGAFRFANLLPGTYLIKIIAATGYIAPHDTSVTVTAGANTYLGLLAFTRTNPGTGSTASINGTVSPVGAAASVSATNQQTGIIVTAVPSSTGAFSFAPLTAGRYKIHAVAAGGYISPADTSVSVADGQNTNMNALIFVKIDPSKASISGTVSPAVGLYKTYTVSVYPAAGLPYNIGVDSTGYFTVANLPPGNYSVFFTGPVGYIAPNTSYLTLTAGEHADYGKIVFRTSVSPYSISGNLIPAGAANYVYAVDAKKGINYYAAVNPYGLFNFSTLPEGSYMLTTTANGFAMLPMAPVNVVDGQVNNVGTIVLVPDPNSYRNFLTWYDNGTFMPGAGSKTCRYISPSLTISQQETTNIQIPEIPSSIADAFYIYLDDVTGPGTYTCKGTATSTIVYKVRVGASSYNPKYYTYSTVNSSGSGSVQITSIDIATRTISGTFSGTLVSADANTLAATKVITNGIIGKVSY